MVIFHSYVKLPEGMVVQLTQIGNMMKYDPKIGLDIWTLVRYHALGYRSTSGVRRCNQATRRALPRS